jgi:penicillin-binding protein 1A
VLEANEHSFRAAFDPSPVIEGALVAVDPRSGHVKAMCGGYDFNRSQFNRVVQARRQPGSSFKPLIYSAALDHNFSPTSVIDDAPISFNDNGKVWSPHNYDGKFHGPVTLRQALTLSLNTVTVRLTNRVGVKTLIPYLQHFGLAGPFAPNLSIALGSAEVTPLELGMAYAVFANGGSRCEPVFISKVTDTKGSVLESHTCEPIQTIPPRTAYQMTSMMQDVVRRGTGTKAALEDRPVAGKTGTTNDFNDNWFVGYTPNLLAAVWIGFDAKQSIGKKETGGRNAAPIWHQFMEGALEGAPYLEFPLPTGLRCVNVDIATGERAAPGPQTRLECLPVPTEPPALEAPLASTPDTLQQVQVRPPKRRESVKDFLRNDL